jgi:hypothetical protein
MAYMRIKSILISVLLVSIHCSALAFSESPILFCKEFVNYAWGYIHNGWLVDSGGNIRSYSSKISDSLDQLSGNPSRANLDKMLSFSNPTGKKIPADSLKSMVALLQTASYGTMSYAMRCADAGKVMYSGIFFDSAHSRYQKVVCVQGGDQTGCNSSSAAKVIARWLISLDSLPFTACFPPDSCLIPSSVVRADGLPKTISVQPQSGNLFFANGKKAPRMSRKFVVKKQLNLIVH